MTPVSQRSAFERLVTKARSELSLRSNTWPAPHSPPVCCSRAWALHKSIFNSGFANSLERPSSARRRLRRTGLGRSSCGIAHRWRWDLCAHRGRRADLRDEGSACSQPLPYNSIHDFQFRQTAGRSRVNLVQEPNHEQLDFDNSDRQNQGHGRELIQGRGAAKNPNESRELSYSCVIDPRTGQVQSGDYQLFGRRVSYERASRLK